MDVDVKRVFQELCDLPVDRQMSELELKLLNSDQRDQVRRLLVQHQTTMGVLARPASDALMNLVVGLGSVFDEYVVEREVGRGGMGIVYHALDTSLDRAVALKTIRPELLHSEHAVGRFRQEARAAAKLEHKNIVRVYRCGHDAGVHYIAMEYVDGKPLKEHLERSRCAPRREPAKVAQNEPMPDDVPGQAEVRRILMLLAEIADALAFAHARGVIHRDVKPSNILVDTTGSAKLTDFGIAKLVSEETLTESGQQLGSVHYMSPEQASIERSTFDHRSDIFSLGIVLYELLTSRKPFAGDGPHQILHAVRTHEPTPVRALNPNVSADLEVVCGKMLEKRSQDRYPTADHVAAEFRCLVRGEPIVARGPSRWRRLRTRVWQHRRPLIAVVFALAVIGFVASLFTARQVWQASRTPVRIESAVPSSSVYAMPMVDGAPLEQGRVRLGEAPLSTSIEPGSYRFIVVSGSTLIGEFDRFAIRGEPIEIRAAPRSLGNPPEGMVLVPSGVHTLGWKGGSGSDAVRRIELESFWIDTQEVSNAEYAEFVRSAGTPPMIWVDHGFDPALGDYPVVGLTLEQMRAYAEWTGKRLPTADEWEAAARFPDARPTPWALEAVPHWVPSLSTEHLLLEKQWTEESELSLYRSLVAPVEAPAEARSMLGLSHTAGNVREATTSQRAADRGAYVVKGGWVTDDPRHWNLARMMTQPHDGPSVRIGFRCVLTAKPPRQGESK